MKTDCAIGILKKLCATLLLNLKEDLSNWISININIFHVNVSECIHYCNVYKINYCHFLKLAVTYGVYPMKLWWYRCTCTVPIAPTYEYCQVILEHISYCFSPPSPCTLPLLFLWLIAECYLLISYNLNVHHMYYMKIYCHWHFHCDKTHSLGTCIPCLVVYCPWKL